ncbi:hypothetical protein ACH347_30015 [Saccharopolyspora sp. 5N102]
METTYFWSALMAWHDTRTSAGLLEPSPMAGVQTGEHFEHPDT